MSAIVVLNDSVLWNGNFGKRNGSELSSPPPSEYTMYRSSLLSTASHTEIATYTAHRLAWLALVGGTTPNPGTVKARHIHTSYADKTEPPSPQFKGQGSLRLDGDAKL